MKKIIYAVICSAIMLFPFAGMLFKAITLPPQYDETFLGEFCEKHERLKTTEGEKLVLIGGSNLAFGIDSELLEQYVGMPVVNYGLYAAIGTKAMLDMSEKYLSSGDIVVICPETNEQTYSLYYNGESMWQAIDSDISMLADAGVENYPKLLSRLPEFVAAKKRFYESEIKPSASGIYSKASFNEYGDIAVERQYNELLRNYDTTMPVSISTKIIGDGFVEYLNDYARKAKSKGASVYFSFSPMNTQAVVSTNDEKSEFYKTLGDSLDFPIISDIDSYIISSAYFYDTNFHLNTRGAGYRTAVLADDILRILGKTEYVETIKYSAPKRPSNYFNTEDADTEDENSKFFSYTKTDGGAIINGLTALGKQNDTLTIPCFANGLPVIEIASGAFEQAPKLKTLIVTAETKLKSIANGAFSGDNKLTRFEIYAQPDKIIVGSKAFESSNGIKVYVPKESYPVFASDYFWGGLMRYVSVIE